MQDNSSNFPELTVICKETVMKETVKMALGIMFILLNYLLGLMKK